MPSKRSIVGATTSLGCALAFSFVGCGQGADTASKGLAPTKVDSIGGVLSIAAPPYNAVPGTDAYPALQAAVNDACAQSTRSGGSVQPVYVPAGLYPLSQSVVLGCTTELVGASRQGTVFLPSFNGPAFLVEPSTVAISTGPALVGSGLSMVEQAAAGQATINLRDVPAVELNGLTAFTAEAFFRVTASSQGNYRSIVTSQGVLGTGGASLGPGFAFGLAVAGTSQPTGSITVNGTSMALAGPSDVAMNVTHHIALTYDGATVRLFVDGAVVASKTAPGAITQRAYEDVTIGPTGQGIEGWISQYPLNGSVDSVRLSNVARYTGTFPVPTKKLQTDANTLALENFDAQLPGVTRVWSGNTPYWIPIRSGGSLIYSVSLHDFTINGEMGVFAQNARLTSIHDLDCLNCDYGIYILGNSLGNTVDDVSVVAGSSRGRFGILMSNRGGNEFHNVALDGQVLPFVAIGGSTDSISSVTVNPGEHTVFGMVIDQTDAVINGVTIGGGGSDYQAGLALLGASVRPVLLNSTIAGNAGRVRRGGPPAAMTTGLATRSVIPVLEDSWGSAVPSQATAIIENTTFTNTAGDPEIIDLNSTPAGGANGGTVVRAVSVDSNATFSNDANVITLTSAGQPPDPTAIPPGNPGIAAILSGVTGQGVFDVNAYGAIPDTPSASHGLDAYPAIQAAVNAACAHGGGTVLLSYGSYTVNRPVLVNCNLEIAGASQRWTRLVSGAGPGLVLNPPGMTGVDLGPPLVGTGHSMKTNGASYWVDISGPFGPGGLDGKGASTDKGGFPGFTAEAFVSATASTPGYAGIVQSAGCLGTPGGTLPGCTSAFQLGAMDGNVYGSLTVGGTAYALQGPTLTLNAVHHVALTYDGMQTIRLFLDGHAVQTRATATMSGTIGQQTDEDLSVGPQTDGFYGNVQNPAIAGYIDSVQVSRTARYSADFTAPTTEPAGDGNTAVLLNFNSDLGGVAAGNGNGIFFPIVRTAEPNGSPEGTVSVTVKNMGFNYRGLFGVNAVNSKFLNLYNEGDGYALTGNSSGSLFDNVYVVYGRLLAANSANSVFHNVSFLRPSASLVIHGGDHIQVNNLVATPDGPAPYGAYFVRSGVTLSNLNLADGLEGTLYKGAVVVDHPTAPFQVYKGVVGGSSTQALAGLTIDSGQGYVLEGVSFGPTTVDAELIHVNAPIDPGAPHLAIGVDYVHTAKLSDDPNIQLIGTAGH